MLVKGVFWWLLGRAGVCVEGVCWWRWCFGAG